jgi:hypothetical protein
LFPANVYPPEEDFEIYGPVLSDDVKEYKLN